VSEYFATVYTSPVTTTYRGNYSFTTSPAAQTFSNVPFGTAAADRRVVVVAATGTALATPSGVTAGGVSGSLVVRVDGGDSMDIDIWIVTVPTGTSGDVVVTQGTASSAGGMAVYTLHGASATANDTDTATQENPYAGTIDVTAGGAVIAGSHANHASNPTSTWSGITEDVDFQTVSVYQMSAAHDDFASAETGKVLGCSYSTHSNSGVAAASFSGGTAANATGTLVSTVQTAPVATTTLSGVILYTDASGTNTLGSSGDLAIYLTANLQGSDPDWTGTNWTEASSYGTPQTFSGSIKRVYLGKTTVTSGTAVAMKAVWANQVAEIPGGSVLISGGTGTIIGSNLSTGLWDGSNTTGQTSGSGTNDWAGKNWGSGVTKTITGIRVWNNENTYGFNVGGANVEVKLQGSTDGSSWVDLGTTGSVPDGQGAAIPFKIEKLSGMTTSTAYQYHRILFNNTTDIRWSELEFYETAAPVAGKVAQLNGWAVNY
jgi:hypothetical protein